MDFIETAQNILRSTRGKNATRWLWPDIMLIRLMYTLLYNATGKMHDAVQSIHYGQCNCTICSPAKKALVKEHQ